MSNIVDLEDDVGHSLPNAEDAKTEAAILGVGRSRRRLLYIVAGILVVVLAILIPVSITMSGGSKSSANLQTGQNQNGQDPPIIEIDPDREHDEKQEEIEDDSGRDGPASESSTLRGELDPTRFADVVAFLSDYSDEVSLGTAGEPQNTAATWIAEFDYLKLPIPEDPDSPEAYRFMQRYVLVLLYQAMNGDEWDYRVNFQTHMSECEWAQGFGTGQDSYQLGVTCDENGFITKLLMPGNGLSGEIYDEIGWLTSMTHLSLFSNDITGEIPDLSLLTDLVFLAMESNELSGVIPEWIGELTALQYLALGDNLLSGELPETMANLVSLQEVALDENQLSGDISVLADLPAIRRLYLGHNTFQGEINEDFLATSEVFELDLADNQFTGIIPGHFFSRNKLEVLDMHSNQIGGNLPQDIDRNGRLKFLSLYDNQISGAMPSDITKWEAVTHLDLSDNAFTGAMPTDLELMTNLRYLYLANNAFTEGPILDLSLLTGLHELSLKNTQRTGNIPDDVNKLQVLVLLDLDGNSLSGQIPATLGSLANLRYLLLNRNQFTGSIPDSFTGLESIDLLLLDNNALTGDDAPICGPDGPGAPSSFITDCVVQCECCSLCCDADDTDCYDDDDLLANIDYAWEAGYRRDAYVFSEDIIFRTNV